MKPALRSVLVILCLASTAGCVDVDEHWSFGEKGGGLYTLTLRWNADLWRRVRGVLGSAVAQRLEGRAAPMATAAWRESLAGLEGVKIVSLDERATDTGMRELVLKVRFAKMAQLMRWEWVARRTVRIEARQPRGARGKAEPVCHVYMEPIARVPVLDRVAALIEAVEHPPPAAEGAAAQRDPGPLERLGLQRGAAELVWKMVKPQLEKVRLRVRFTTPFDLAERGARGVDVGPREVAFDFGFADLRKSTADRTVGFAWQMRAFDEAPVVDHRGDRDPRPAGPDGRGR